MNTALSWIKAYVPDLDVTAQEYTDAMTLTGTKVEGFTCLDKNLEKIVVGEILSVERHPDADKLHQNDVAHDRVFQRVVHHGAPAVFHHYLLIIKFLNIGKGLDQSLGLH